MRVVVIILTSSKLELLKLCLKSVINQKNTLLQYDVIINVNTLDELYYNSVIRHFEKITDKSENNSYPISLKIIHTKSNGKPGMGHTSNLEYFRCTNYDYAIIIDGDDFFYPYAFYRLEYFLNMHPIAVNLYGHDELLIGHSRLSAENNSQIPNATYSFNLKIQRPAPEHGIGIIYFKLCF